MPVRKSNVGWLIAAVLASAISCIGFMFPLRVLYPFDCIIAFGHLLDAPDDLLPVAPCLAMCGATYFVSIAVIIGLVRRNSFARVGALLMLAAGVAAWCFGFANLASLYPGERFPWIGFIYCAYLLLSVVGGWRAFCGPKEEWGKGLPHAVTIVCAVLVLCSVFFVNFMTYGVSRGVVLRLRGAKLWGEVVMVQNRGQLEKVCLLELKDQPSERFVLKPGETYEADAKAGVRGRLTVQGDARARYFTVDKDPEGYMASLARERMVDCELGRPCDMPTTVPVAFNYVKWMWVFPQMAIKNMSAIETLNCRIVVSQGGMSVMKRRKLAPHESVRLSSLGFENLMPDAIICVMVAGYESAAFYTVE